MTANRRHNALLRITSPVIGAILLAVGGLQLTAAQTPSPLALTPAGEQFTQALTALPNQRVLSIVELQQLTFAMLSEEAPADISNAWAETLVWRFGQNDDSVPSQVAFALFSQGVPLSRIDAGNQEAVRPAQALDEILTSRSANARFKTALEWTYQLQPLARRNDVTGASAAVVLNLANRLIGTQDPSLPPIPPTDAFVNNNANLWLWELLASELRGQKDAALESRLARVDGPMERRTRRTTVRGWGRVIGELPGSAAQAQGDFTGSVPVSPFSTAPSGQVNAFFEQVQRHKASFLPNGQSERPATVSEIQAIVGPPGSTNPSLAIEFCRVGNDYAAIIFDRTPPDQARVAVVRASSLGGVLAGLNSGANYQGLVVVLAIDAGFESGDYATLNSRFSLNRSRNEKCLLCPSLSMLTKDSGTKSQWSADEVLRYAHFSGDYALSDIPTARRVSSFTFLNHLALRTRGGSNVLLMCD